MTDYVLHHVEFITDDRSVDVNEGSTQTPLTLTVERVGGAVGVVQVMWTLTRIDGMPYWKICASVLGNAYPYTLYPLLYILCIISFLPFYIFIHFILPSLPSYPSLLLSSPLPSILLSPSLPSLPLLLLFLPSQGGDPSEDILPTSGSLQFITNGRQQTITLTVLPDDLPEVDEVN